MSGPEPTGEGASGCALALRAHRGRARSARLSGRVGEGSAAFSAAPKRVSVAGARAEGAKAPRGSGAAAPGEPGEPEVKRRRSRSGAALAAAWRTRSASEDASPPGGDNGAAFRAQRGQTDARVFDAAQRARKRERRRERATAYSYRFCYLDWLYLWSFIDLSLRASLTLAAL